MFNRLKWTDASQKRNGLTAKYEPVQPFIILEFIRSVDASTFVDVGANIGQYSLFASLSGKIKKTYAFEAEEAAYRELTENVKLNQQQNVITPYLNAASSEEGDVSFSVANPMAGNNAITSTTIHTSNVYNEMRTVHAVRVDDVVTEKGARMAVKIDVEGHETEVLRGARATLTDNRAVLQIEAYTGQEDVFNTLDSYGYEHVLSVGPDHYFSNFEQIKRESCLPIVESALAELINYNLNG